VPATIIESPVRDVIAPSAKAITEPSSDEVRFAEKTTLTDEPLSFSCLNAGIAETADEGTFVMWADSSLADAFHFAVLGQLKCLRPMLAILAHNQGLYDIEEEARTRISKLELASKRMS
jgi:hypothetical protein